MNGYLPRSFCTLNELCDDADEQLFFSFRYNPSHVIHHLLPSLKVLITVYANALIILLYRWTKQNLNFVYKMVFKDIFLFLPITSAFTHCNMCVCRVIKGFTYLAYLLYYKIFRRMCRWKISKIGQYLATMWWKVCGLLFKGHPV